MPSRSPNANRPVGAHGVATDLWACWSSLAESCQLRHRGIMPSNLAAHHSYLAARSSRPLPQHRSKLMCATYTETLIRRGPNEPCFNRSFSLLACLKASRRSLNWQSIRDIPDVRDVFLERHASEVGVLRAFRSVVLRAAHLTLKQTLGDHRISPIHARRLRLASWGSSAFSSNHFRRER